MPKGHAIPGREARRSAWRVRRSTTRMRPSRSSKRLPAGPYVLSIVDRHDQHQRHHPPPTRDLNTANNVVIDPTPIFVYSSGADYESGSRGPDVERLLPRRRWTSHRRDAHHSQSRGRRRSLSLQLLLEPAQRDADRQRRSGRDRDQHRRNLPRDDAAPFAAFGQPGAQNTATDQIIIPSGGSAGALQPGPGARSPEPGRRHQPRPTNDDRAVAINIAANPLQITSPSSLTAGILGTPYVNALTEQGAGTHDDLVAAGGIAAARHLAEPRRATSLERRPKQGSTR